MLFLAVLPSTEPAAALGGAVVAALQGRDTTTTGRQARAGQREQCNTGHGGGVGWAPRPGSNALGGLLGPYRCSPGTPRRVPGPPALQHRRQHAS